MDQKQRLWALGICLVPIVIIVAIIALINNYIHLEQSGNQAAADRLMTISVVSVIGVIVLVVLVAAVVFSRVIRRFSAEQARRFEASIAHLDVEEQRAARRSRAVKQAALAMGAYVVAHEGMKIMEHHRREDLERTRERIDQINQLLEEHRRDL